MLNLINSNQVPETAVTGTYDLFYVFLSYVVASFAAWIAILILDDITRSDAKMRIKGCFLGALVMGAGIWSMHFTGMLAYDMGMEHSYDIWITIASMVIASCFSFAVFYNITREKLRLTDLLIDAPLMGLGVASMHYVGMAAMDMRAKTLYISSLFWLSIAIAIAASGAAMLIMRFVNTSQKYKKSLSFAAALIMGLAVCAMHYTGMEATVLVPFPDCRFVKNQDTTILFTAIVLVSISISILGIYLVSKGFLTEKSAQSTIFSNNGIIISNSIIIVIGASIFWFLNYESNKGQLNNIKNFQEKEYLKVENISQAIENLMSRIHSKLTVLSSLHFVKKEIGNFSKFTQSSMENVQYVANGLMDVRNDTMSIKFFRFYSMEQGENAKGNVSLFDSFNVEKEKQPNDKKDLNLIQNHEDQIDEIVKKQAQWFYKKYNSYDSFEKNTQPSRVDWMHPVLSNSDTSSKTNVMENFPIVYSIPIYGKHGKITGIVSCVFTTILFHNITSSLPGALILMSSDEGKNIFPTILPGHLRGSLKWIHKNEPDPNLIYSITSPLVIQDSHHLWSVWM